MKKLVFLATAAGLFLVSNAPPPRDSDDGAYPPCSRRVTDNCVQRVRGEPEARALDAMPPGEDSGPPDGYAAAPAPVVRTAPPAPPRRIAARAYPPCSANVQDRCIQGRARHGHHVRYARRVRHAGERG